MSELVNTMKLAQQYSTTTLDGTYRKWEPLPKIRVPILYCYPYALLVAQKNYLVINYKSFFSFKKIIHIVCCRLTLSWRNRFYPFLYNMRMLKIPRTFEVLLNSLHLKVEFITAESQFYTEIKRVISESIILLVNPSTNWSNPIICRRLMG